MEEKNIEVKWVEVQKVKPYKENAKKHGPEQVKAIAEQIMQFGWDQPIVVDKDMVVVKGHGRRAAAILLGLKKVPVYVAEHLTEEQAIAARVGDNKVAESPWDNEYLKFAFERLKAMNYDPALTGFKVNDMQKMLDTFKPIEGHKIPDTFVTGKQGEGELVDIDKLRPHPRNYRTHPEDQLKHLIESIKEFGIYKNIVVAQDYTILTGHALFEAAKLLNISKLPVKRFDYDPESPRALKILTNDNELGHFAVVDDRLLTDLLKQIKENDPTGLLGTGYDERMLANLVMVTRHENEIADINEAAHWVGMPEFDNEDSPYKLVVSFENEDMRNEFLKRIKVKNLSKATGKTLSMWWPQREKQDLKSVKFEDKNAEA
jgi:ParB-like chromosome segregation protein Spo0J